MEKKYRIIKLGKGHKLHVFNDKKDKILCGVDRWKYPPFHINKTLFNIDDMIDKVEGVSERRAGPNPYKFVCIKCEELLNKKRR